MKNKHIHIIVYFCFLIFFAVSSGILQKFFSDTFMIVFTICFTVLMIIALICFTMTTKNNNNSIWKNNKINGLSEKWQKIFDSIPSESLIMNKKCKSKDNNCEVEEYYSKTKAEIDLFKAYVNAITDL